MRTNKLKVGIIGLGAGLAHLRACQKNLRLEVKAICDLNEAKLKEVSKEYQISKVYTDYRRMVDEESLDIVVVASPDRFHCEQSVYALKSGSNVIVEKPMTISLKGCEEMIKAVEETGKKLIVNQILRFNPRFKKIKELVERNVLGEIFYAEGDYIHNIKHLIVGKWRGEKENAHSPFLGGGCHAIDLLRWIVGEVKEISAYGSKKCIPEKDYPFPDCEVAILKFDNEAIGKYLGNFACQRPSFRNLMLYGTRATYLNGVEKDIIYFDSELNHHIDINIPYAGHPFEPMIDHFTDCLLNDKDVLINVYDGANTVSVALAGDESLIKGKAIKPIRF